MPAIIQVRRGQAAAWASANPILSPGEFGYETDTGKLRLGDGYTHWNDLQDFPVAADKGQPNGYAALDADGLVPLEQLPITNADWATLEGKPTYVAAGETQADARSAIGAEYTGNKGQTGGYASLDGTGKVPSDQLPTISWTTLTDKPAVVAAGATKADARSAVDAEYTGNKGQPDGYAELDSSGRVPIPQLPAGMVVDSVQVNSESFQFYSGNTPVGDPISTVLAGVDGGTPTAVTSVRVDGGVV